MARMDFIESRVELKGGCFEVFDDWAAMWAHVCDGRDGGCGV
jgi:hypothetical protein